MYQNEKQDGVILNILAFANLVLPSLGNIIGPLIFWLIKKDQSPYLNEMGKNVLNFNISITIYWFVSGILMIVLIGFLLLPAFSVMWLVFTIIGIVKANNGEIYNFPLTIKFIR